MEYRIVLQRMEFRALHGCYELERKVGNRFTVALEITACLAAAGGADRLFTDGDAPRAQGKPQRG